VTCEEPELLTDVRDFTNLFYGNFEAQASEWLESSIKSDFGTLCAMEP